MNIRELERKGWVIDRTREESEGKYYVRYSFPAEQQAKAAA